MAVDHNIRKEKPLSKSDALCLEEPSGRKKNQNHGTSSTSSAAGNEHIVSTIKSYEPPLFVTTQEENKKLDLASTKIKKLKAHQVDGVQWLWELHCRGLGSGGIIGDDMGVGKTFQLCIFILSLFQSNLINKVLIVSPNTLLKQWCEEFLHCGYQAHIYYGASKKSALDQLKVRGILITTYDTLVSNVESLGSHRWNYLVIDEGHLIKNSKTIRNNRLMDITSDHRVLLTGTMIQNGIDELWPLLNFCCPSVFNDLKHFKECYTRHIKSGTSKNSSADQEYSYKVASELLKNAIKPYYLRRTKEQVLELPKKHEFAVWLKPTESQRYLYQTFVEDPQVRSAISNKEAFEVINIQRQLCNHPSLVNTGKKVQKNRNAFGKVSSKVFAKQADKATVSLSSKIADIMAEYLLNNDDIESSKLLFLDTLLVNLYSEGHHVLIFSQMKDMLNLIQDLLTKREFKFLRIDGGCSLKDRNNSVNEFQAGAAQILLLSTRVAGVGLTLTKANRVILVDPSWNQSTDDQSVCRAYRLGQEKDILVYRLLTCGTAEETIYKNQIHKQMLSKVVLEEELPFCYFTEKERRDIFKINKDDFDKSVTQQNLDKEHKCLCEMDCDLEEHIMFLQQLPVIACIGHHTHLFSKLPIKDESRAPHAMMPKEFKSPNRSSFKKENTYPQEASNPHSSWFKTTERPTGNDERRAPHAMMPKDFKSPNRSCLKKQTNHPQPVQGVEALHRHSSWFKTTERPTVKKQAQPLQVVETNNRRVNSRGFSFKEMCLEVPPDLVNLLDVNELEAESRARIQFSKKEAIARITGTAEQVLTARRLVNSQIKKLQCNQQ